jgi:hypothetical protein
VQLAQPGGSAPDAVRPATNCLKCTAFRAGLPAGEVQVSRSTGPCDRRGYTLGYSRWNGDEVGGWRRGRGRRDGWQRFPSQGLRKMVTDTARERRLGALVGGAELRYCRGCVRALLQEKFLAAASWFVSFVTRLSSASHLSVNLATLRVQLLSGRKSSPSSGIHLPGS